jgi:hypothetical protein
MRIESFVCNVCEKVKGETNHWYGIRLDQIGPHHDIVIVSFESALGLELTGDKGWKFEHVCGSECLHKRIDAMLVGL